MPKKHICPQKKKNEVSNKINSIISTIGLYKATGGTDLYKINETI